jgi:hypothetical protein
MHRLLGCALLGLAVCAAGLGAQGDKGTKDGKKGTRAGNEVVGKVKAVDLEKKSFTITPEAGKDRTFLVDDKTKFVGPRGGVSKEGLTDDRLARGFEVKVTPAPDGKTAREVQLPFRKKADKGKTASVSGKVLYKGVPLPGGTVTFHPTKGKAVTGVIQSDGTYEALGVPVGEARLTVETASVKAGPAKEPKLKTAPKDKGLPAKGGGAAPRYVPIPQLYADVKTSALTVEVKPGKNNVDINLN